MKRHESRGAIAIAALCAVSVALGSCAHDQNRRAPTANQGGPGQGGFGGPPPDGQGPMGPPPDGSMGGMAQGGPDNQGGPGMQGGPGGMGQGPNGGNGQQNAGKTAASIKIMAAYYQSGGKAAKEGQSYTAAGVDRSAVYVTKAGTLDLSKSLLSSTSRSSAVQASDFFGLNAVLLAAEGSTVLLTDCEIRSEGEGANAAFATGAGSTVTLKNVKITTTANAARGADATIGGTIRGENVDISTAGMHSAALATDRGRGTVIMQGGKMATAGVDSPGIYSTGDIQVSDATVSAAGSEAAVVEGKNSIALRNVELSGAKKNGVMLYQSFSGDAEVGLASFEMEEGSLSAIEGSLFFVTNATAKAELRHVKARVASGKLVTAAATERWGKKGANGGHFTLRAYEQELAGDVEADPISSVTLVLRDGSVLTGKVTNAAVELDAKSIWVVTADSAVTSLTLRGLKGEPDFACLKDGGKTIRYDAKNNANAYLGGKTYALPEGGRLLPAD